jgi:lipooligosaccharide transport system ATP-binding protein
MNIVSAHSLVKNYGIVTAVNGVDFAIFPNECFGFLGPNGAGKTTVMRIISCFLPPTSGSVTVFGLDVKERPSDIKARLGVMPQEDNLDPDLSVFENLVVYARYFDIAKRDSVPLVNELLQFVELQERGGMSIKELSGGMKRRLMLARSLVNSPELLILDEPTTGLDPHSRRAVWEKLNLLKLRNTTLLLTTHYMEEAERLCDRVAIMDQGKIVTIDSPKNLMEEHGGDLEEVYLKLTGRSLED